MPGPVSGSFGTGCDQFWLKEWIAQTALQVLAGESPGKWLVEGGVALAERDDALHQLVQRGAVIRREHLALDDRKIKFDLIEPAGMDGRVDDDDAGMTCSKLFGGAFATMR